MVSEPTLQDLVEPLIVTPPFIADHGKIVAENLSTQWSLLVLGTPPVNLTFLVKLDCINCLL